MRTEIVTLAAILAAALAPAGQARAPQESGAPQPAANLILAQARGDATCKLEERNVPQGTSVCREGYVVRCSARGSWERTDKRC